MSQLERISGFLEAYRAIDDPGARLGSFLDQWRQCPKLARPGVRVLNVDRLAAALDELAEPLARSRAEGRFINPWIAAGLRRSEVRNAAVLAQLWRPELAGEPARHFLNAFLRIVEQRSRCPLPSAAALAKGYRVRTEHCLAGEASERVDLTVEGPGFIIGVEVKIDAAEGHAQLERYAAALAARAALRGAAPFLIFLAPYPHRGAVDGDARVPVTDASWKDIEQAAQLLPGDADSFARQLIDRFAAHVTDF